MAVKKQWKIKHSRITNKREISEISEQLKIQTLTAELMFNRGMTTPKSARAFLQRDTESFHNPFLMKDMDKAAERIIAAIDNHEKIVIFGDYDVDGVTSVSVLYLYLKSKNADVDYYIPNRIGEGYGMNTTAIERLSENGTKLIITVDTGITAVKETAYAISLGIDMVITDHHECHGDIPECSAVVNPHRRDCGYPFKELAGVGVVFKLVSALEKTLCPDDENLLEAVFDKYADLVAIGTIADVMPLKDENRLIVSIGLRLTEEHCRPGISALLEAASGGGNLKTYKSAQKKRKITSSLIGFTIAPRLNAAGRMDSASLAVELFLTDDYDKALEIAVRLCEANIERQRTENEIVEEAYEKIVNEIDFSRDRAIVLDSDGWHHGVIGIVASRITEKYNMPSIMISFRDSAEDGDEAVGKGSGRSIKGINLVDALSHCSSHLVRFGGHELAAGLSVKRCELAAFKNALNEYISSFLPDGSREIELEADAEINADELTLKNASEIALLEPFGTSNPVPVLALCDCTVEDIQSIGADKHTKMLLSNSGKTVQAIWFGKKASDLMIYRGDRINVFFNLDINDFQGVQSVQMIVRDAIPSEDEAELRRKMNDYYTELKNGRTIEENEDVIPSREDFAAVYTFLRRTVKDGVARLNIYQTEKTVFDTEKIGYFKLHTILDIFDETGLMKVDFDSDGCANGSLEITFNYPSEKIDIEKSVVYTKLISQRA